MSRLQTIRHEFVEYVPDVPDEGVLYVSIGFKTTVHLCCCGCGIEVVTPISRADWQITFDGETVSLYPSIGNWSLPCRSHYWIRENRVAWARSWTKKQIARGLASDRSAVKRRFERGCPENGDVPAASTPDTHNRQESLWQRIRRVLS